MRERFVRLMSGARVTVDTSPRFAVPLGVRYGGRVFSHSCYAGAYREWWLQGRVLVFPTSPKLGADAEIVFHRFGAVMFAEYLPSLEEESAPHCSISTGECALTTSRTSLRISRAGRNGRSA